MALELLKKGTFTISDTELKGVDDHDSTVAYTCQVITPADRERISRETRLEDGRDAPWDVVLDAMIEFCLTGWSGIVDQGVVAPCTTENKRCLDQPRKIALVNVCGRMRRAAEARAESFRQS